MPLAMVAWARPWLLPLLAVPLVALAASWRDAPRLLVAVSLAGLAWLCLESLAITHRGWAWAWIGGLLGAAPTQPALGWGALGYALACTMLAAAGLARRGWCRGDMFVLGAILLILGAILIFVFWPVMTVLISAVRDNDGAFAPVLFWEKFSDRSIWGLECLSDARSCGAAWNTLFLAVLVGVLSTLLGLAFALVALRTGLPLKGPIRLLSLLPIITPPFVIGLALIIMFGRAGFITSFLYQTFDIPRSRWLYGWPGVAIAQLLAFTPIAFLVLVGVLQAVAPSLEEAAGTLRAGRWHIFRTITWPLIRPGLANAFLIGFIESMADFGNPLMLGGSFNVLSTDIFFAVVGAAHDQGRAAILGIVLLAFTMAAFTSQRLWVGTRSYTTVTGKGDGGVPPPLPLGLRAACYATVLPWLALTVVVYGIILGGGFVVSVGRDHTPTLKYFLTAFSIDRGVGGWFLSGSAWSSFLTTMQLSVIAMPLTAALGLLTAWLLARQEFRGRGAFEFLTMMSFAIPGTVIGISYILAFNTPPVELTGTGTILVLAFMFRNMPVGIRAGIASLAQIDKSLDEASLTLGARSGRTFRLVILPILRPAIIAAMVYSFVRAVTAVSAVIFLTTAQYQLATVYIVGRAEIGEYGIALAYSAVLIVVMVAALIAIRALVGEQRIGRRQADTGAVPIGLSAS
ncbi:MAG: iron ABC transporter permease [Acetobacteraceae bacterium]|nr:iron ABC transporter permease [Acetobacteraceae bacterium]